MTSKSETEERMSPKLAPDSLIIPRNNNKINKKVYSWASRNSIIKQGLSCCLSCNSIVLLSDNKRLTPSSYLPDLPPISCERITTAPGWGRSCSAPARVLKSRLIYAQASEGSSSDVSLCYRVGALSPSRFQGRLIQSADSNAPLPGGAQSPSTPNISDE